MLLLCVVTLTFANAVPVPVLRHSHMTSYDNNGTTCFKCGPGTFVVKHCTSNFTYSDCDPCPIGQFQSNWTRATRCEYCRPYCFHDRNMEIVGNCSATQNLRCECKPGYFLHVQDEFMKHYTCKKYKECGSGQIVIKNGTSTSDQVCGFCPPGHFYGDTGQCEACTSCEDRNSTQLTPCQATADTVCQTNVNATTNNTSINTTSTTVTTPESTNTGHNVTMMLLYIVPPLAFLTLLAGTVVVAMKYCKTKTNEDEEKKGEESEAMIVRQPSTTSRLQRTLSNSSSGEPRPSTKFRYLQDRKVWKAKVFLFLCQRLSKNWKQFMRHLPGDEHYASHIDSLCDQIEMENPTNVQEQIHTALNKWANAHFDDKVNIDNIMNTLKEVHEDVQTLEDLLKLYSKLNEEQERKESKIRSL